MVKFESQYVPKLNLPKMFETGCKRHQHMDNKLNEGDFHGKLVLLVLLRENGNCIFGSSLLLVLTLELDIFLSSPSLPGVTVETARRFIIYNLL